MPSGPYVPFHPNYNSWLASDHNARGRRAFLPEEDKVILDWVQSNPSMPRSGNELWKLLADNGVRRCGLNDLHGSCTSRPSTAAGAPCARDISTFWHTAWRLVCVLSGKFHHEVNTSQSSEEASSAPLEHSEGRSSRISSSHHVICTCDRPVAQEAAASGVGSD